MATILPLLEALGSEMSLTILACRLLKLFREKLRSELGSPRVLMIVEYVGEGKVILRSRADEVCTPVPSAISGFVRASSTHWINACFKIDITNVL